ncbi:BofC-like protein [Hydrogenispora ethanolica]|uniref:BofC-like protein n=2 Tax=Hydrogenispora ethanolica TaxID=1082276 RepID=A0A4R1QRN5_HYDET|nr:BofC-like protein [Hydrogenispora ethanolica]
MKLPAFYRVMLRIGVAVLVVAATFAWAVHNPRKIDQLRGMLAPAVKERPAQRFLEIRSEYTLCGHWKLDKVAFPSEDSLQAAVEKHPEYQFQKQSGNRYSYSVSVSGYCDSCRDNRFLGMDRQDVAVFRGTPSRPGPVVERVTLRVHFLPQSELDDLIKGIPFRDSREKLQLIEGLNGLIIE